MGFLAGKTAIITGAGYAKLSNGRCGSIAHLTIRIVYYIENDHFPSNEEIEQEGVFAI